MTSTESGTPGSGARGWRPGPVAIAVGVLVAVTSAFAKEPLRDAVTGATVDGAILERPLGFVLGAPLFGVWDTLGLLTLSQHYALFVTLIALYLSWRSRVRRSERARALSGPLPIGTRIVREVRNAGRAVLAVVLLYAGGMLVPRPMARIQISDPDLVVVDFHSHTHHSHDAWSLFDAARNRAWHEAGGFDAAYVTDHYTWQGVDEAEAMNPRRAGDGLVLLEGAEIRIHGRPTNALGSRVRYLPVLDEDSVFMDAERLRAMARDTTALPATLLYTMPGSLEEVVPLGPAEAAGVVGIEINDGSPRGLEQTRAERDRIVALADSVDLALVSASNLHGWGRTVTGWSLLALPGWQELSPRELGSRIEETLHSERRDAVRVVERWRPYHQQSPVRVAMTLPLIAVDHFRELTWAERTSWLVWLLLGSALWTKLVARRGRA